MSAFIVHADTVDLIASAAERYSSSTFYGKDGLRLHPVTDAARIGAVLMAENVRSVHYRHDACFTSEPYTFRRVDLDAVALGHSIYALVLASIAGLRYQSCESQHYEQTDAAKLLNRIEKDVILAMTNEVYASWGWTREAAEARKADILRAAR